MPETLLIVRTQRRENFPDHIDPERDLSFVRDHVREGWGETLDVHEVPVDQLQQQLDGLSAGLHNMSAMADRLQMLFTLPID